MTTEQMNARMAEFKEVLKLNLERAGFTVDGQRINGCWIGIQFIAQVFHTSYTGKWSLVIGEHGDKKRFPQRKNGSFTWSKIIEEIRYRIGLEEARRKKRKELKANRALIAEIKKSYGLLEWNDTLTVGEHGGFQLIIRCEDPSKLAVLLSLAIQMGVVEQ